MRTLVLKAIVDLLSLSSANFFFYNAFSSARFISHVVTHGVSVGMQGVSVSVVGVHCAVVHGVGVQEDDMHGMGMYGVDMHGMSLYDVVEYKVGVHGGGQACTSGVYAYMGPLVDPAIVDYRFPIPTVSKQTSNCLLVPIFHY